MENVYQGMGNKLFTVHNIKYHLDNNVTEQNIMKKI